MNIEQYVTYDLPIPYKKLKIYPATVRDYVLFSSFSQCFMLDKNSIPDARIISMTELEYIFHSTIKEDKPYLLWMDRLFSMCLKDDPTFMDFENSITRYEYNDKGKPQFKVGEERYDSKDYDEIRAIICEQNMVELPDESMSKAVRDSLDEAKEYKRKLSGDKPASIEDYIVSLSGVTGWSFEYIYGMSIRKFTKSIRRMDNLIHYKIYLSASMSGMVEFKDKSFIKHWLSNTDADDKYADVSMDLTDVQNKVSLESAKK